MNSKRRHALASAKEHFDLSGFGEIDAEAEMAPGHFRPYQETDRLLIIKINGTPR